MDTMSRMKSIALFGLLMVLPQVCTGDVEMNTRTLVDFNHPDRAGTWRIINDGVMGGLSTSAFVLTEDSTAVFRGEVSLENNGGFASVRSEPAAHGVEDAAGYRLRVRGDGRRYSFRLRTNDRFDGVAYQVLFETTPDAWMTVELPVSGFTPTYRGRRVVDAPPLNPAAVRQLGFLIGDKQEGPFRLEIARIEAYQETKASP
jgi:monofunctional biosynthetic peptidoglycan transglycosylase